jgi:hypothetical protein
VCLKPVAPYTEITFHRALEFELFASFSYGIALDLTNVPSDTLVSHCLGLPFIVDEVDLVEGYTLFLEPLPPNHVGSLHQYSFSVLE